MVQPILWPNDLTSGSKTLSHNCIPCPHTIVPQTAIQAVSSRMLYKLAQDCLAAGEFTPKKYFSIDRVFRNEALDKTHLAEFHQVEGETEGPAISMPDGVSSMGLLVLHSMVPDMAPFVSTSPLLSC